MPSIRKVKRAAQIRFSALMLGYSVAPNGDVSVRLPGRRKAVHLTRMELTFIRALPDPLGSQSTSGCALSSSPFSATCETGSNAGQFLQLVDRSASCTTPPESCSH